MGGARPIIFLAVVLGGCGTDWGLTELSADPGADDPIARPSRPAPGGPGGPGGGGGGGGGGPWGDFDPGRLPDVYFAVALGYASYDTYGSCCWDCDTDGLWDCYGGPPEYVVVDLKGQVVAQFEPPDVNFSPWSATHLALVPGGPGQFVAVTWLPALDQGPEQESGVTDDADGFSNSWPGPTWLAWRGDAVSGAATSLAHGVSDWTDARARVVGSGRDVPLSGAWANVQLGMLADAPEGLLLWSGAEGCGLEATEPVRSVHLLDPSAPDIEWGTEELVPWPLQKDGWQTWPLTLQTGLAADGRTSMLVGVGASQCSYAVDQRYWIGALDDQDAMMWQHWLPADLWPRSFAYSGLGGGGALHVSGVQPQQWTLYGPHEPISGDLDPGLVNWRVGELLDPSGPTFLLTATDPTTWTDRMVIFHAGKPIWTIDKLRYGLEKRTFSVADVVLVPPALP